jgi:site-specific DNA recombinase
MMKAAIYARYSTDKQRDASIEDQFRECERAAASAGIEVVAHFEDKGISAGTAERPGYQALLRAARARHFNVIITEDISRLWRNRAEFGPRSAELEDLGVHWLSCVGQDARRDGWGLVVQILQAIRSSKGGRPPTARAAASRAARGTASPPAAGPMDT